MIAWHLYLSPCPTFIFIYLPMICFCGGKISLCILACDYLTVAWLEQIRKKNNPHYYWCKQLDVVVYCLLNTIQIIILHFIHFWCLIFHATTHHIIWSVVTLKQFQFSWLLNFLISYCTNVFCYMEIRLDLSLLFFKN